jgi:hypothetical protein
MFLIKAFSRKAIRGKKCGRNWDCFYFLSEKKIVKRFVQCHLFATRGELSGGVLSRTGILEHYERDEQQARVSRRLYILRGPTKAVLSHLLLFIHLFINSFIHSFIRLFIYLFIHSFRLHVHTDPGKRNENLERQIGN